MGTFARLSNDILLDLGGLGLHGHLGIEEFALDLLPARGGLGGVGGVPQPLFGLPRALLDSGLGLFFGGRKHV